MKQIAKIEKEEKDLRVDVRDGAGHLLFRYNPLNDTIEIKSRNRVVAVSITDMRFIAKRNVLSDEPVTSLTLADEELGTLIPPFPLEAVVALVDASAKISMPESIDNPAVEA